MGAHLQAVAAGGVGMADGAGTCMRRLIAAERRLPSRDLLRVGGLPSALARDQPLSNNEAAGRVGVQLPDSRSAGSSEGSSSQHSTPVVPDVALPELLNAIATLFDWRIAGSLRSAVNMAGAPRARLQQHAGARAHHRHASASGACQAAAAAQCRFSW